MLLIDGKLSQISENFNVVRTLPDRQKRMVGPFCFLDHMGPIEILPPTTIDIPPHPHIGLSTLTYLYQGRSVHRDSLGTLIDVLPGDVNLMTSGRGVVHSEREHSEDKQSPRSYHGLQFWLALPDSLEDCEPSFTHYDKKDIPVFKQNRLQASVVVGEAYGLRSPVRLPSPTLFLDVNCEGGGAWSFPASANELAVYVISGEITCSQGVVGAKQMGVFSQGEGVDLEFKGSAHFILIGGEPFSDRKHIWWNFVSSSKDKIEQAKVRWRERLFEAVPGETEFVPLPGERP